MPEQAPPGGLRPSCLDSASSYRHNGPPDVGALRHPPESVERRSRKVLAEAPSTGSVCLRSLVWDNRGDPVKDYVVSVVGFVRTSGTGERIHYMTAMKTDNTPGDQVDLILSRLSSNTAAEISGTVENPDALVGDYISVDLFKAGDDGGFEQYVQEINPDGSFTFVGLDTAKQYYLGFGVYTADNNGYLGAGRTCFF